VGTVQSLREESRMPVRIVVELREGAIGALRDALASQRIDGFRSTGSTAEFRCDRGSKVAVLGALSHLADRLLDVQIAEPSLEDVFMAYSDTTP